MMKISTDTIQHLQNLSKLNIEDEQHFTEKLNSVIQYIETISNAPLATTGEVSNSHTLESLDSITAPGEKGLLDNVEHEKINNSIVIQTKL